MKRVLLLLFLVGCGGSKPAPMTPEPSKDQDPPSLEALVNDAGLVSNDDAGEPPPPLPPADNAKGNPPPVDAAKGTEEGAQTVLKQFVAPNADNVALTKALRPTSTDFKTLFDSSIASKIEAAQNKDWDSGTAVLKPKAGQTEVKLWSATTSDLAGGKGNAKDFPVEYKKIAKHFLPDDVFYRFKFVAPGKDVGTAYDGLTFVNGHWVIVSKPWHGLDGKAEKPATKKKKKK